VTYPMPDDEHVDAGPQHDGQEVQQALPSATDKLLELVDALERSSDIDTIRTLVAAQTVIALNEQNRRLAQDHNAFIARFEELVDRFVGALEDGSAGIVSEIAQLIASMAARS
jgi:hypothetical protein